MTECDCVIGLLVLSLTLQACFGRPRGNWFLAAAARWDFAIYRSFTVETGPAESQR